MHGSGIARRGWLCRPSVVALLAAALLLAVPSAAGAYAYWVNGSTESIARANLDGGTVEQTFTPAGGVPRAKSKQLTLRLGRR